MVSLTPLSLISLNKGGRSLRESCRCRTLPLTWPQLPRPAVFLLTQKVTLSASGSHVLVLFGGSSRSGELAWGTTKENLYVLT